MMPNAILPANHIYRDQSKDKDVVNGKPVNRMVKDLLDGGVGIIETPKVKKSMIVRTLKAS